MSLRKALGLTFFAALALMAISAPGASATTGALLILNSAENTLSELHATLGGEIDKPGEVLVEGELHVAAINLVIACDKFTVQEGLYLATDHIGHAALLYEDCKIYQLSPKVNLNCEVYPSAADRTAGTNKGKIKATGLLLVLKHTGTDGNKNVVRVKSISAHMFFKLCPTGNLALVTGKVTLLTTTGGNGQHAVKHLFEPAGGTFNLDKDQLLYGESSVATILGSVWIFLTGGHNGLKWGLC
jgi:hypothetical protein